MHCLIDVARSVTERTRKPCARWGRPLPFFFAVSLGCLCLALCGYWPIFADGKIFVPRDYKGSIEEQSQEAIIIFNRSDGEEGSDEDLILKIGVQGKEPVESFGWVVPFPTPPKVTRESPKLFEECFDYVQARKAQLSSGKGKFEGEQGAKPAAKVGAESVEVISRKTVGSYDVAVVREKVRGSLNKWLEQEGFQTLDEGNEVLEYYRKKSYVFACMKVLEAGLEKGKTVDLHPLRFTFKTRGKDGIYFPMKLTGLQEDQFNVNLYIFYGKWLNNNLSRFGYEHRGFHLNYRDWDTRQCKPNAGKSWSAPQRDPFLESLAPRIPTLTKLFQKLHPGEKYYLTNIRVHALNPEEIRQWSGDLWLFPFYTNRDFVPYDARKGGPAADVYPRTE